MRCYVLVSFDMTQNQDVQEELREIIRTIQAEVGSKIPENRPLAYATFDPTQVIELDIMTEEIERGVKNVRRPSTPSDQGG